MVGPLNTAQVSAMCATFLRVTLAGGAPPILAALPLAFFSKLSSSRTHQGTGPAPVLIRGGARGGDRLVVHRALMNLAV